MMHQNSANFKSIEFATTFLLQWPQAEPQNAEKTHRPLVAGILDLDVKGWLLEDLGAFLSAFVLRNFVFISMNSSNVLLYDECGFSIIRLYSSLYFSSRAWIVAPVYNPSETMTLPQRPHIVSVDIFSDASLHNTAQRCKSPATSRFYIQCKLMAEALANNLK